MTNVGGCRQRETQILKQGNTNANKFLEPLPDQIDVIQQHNALVEHLHNADRVKLAHAISLTVASIIKEFTKWINGVRAIGNNLAGNFQHSF